VSKLVAREGDPKSFEQLFIVTVEEIGAKSKEFPNSIIMTAVFTFY